MTMDLSHIPPESFKPVVCVHCGCPVFVPKVVMQYYKGILTPGPVLREVPMRVCDNCRAPFDQNNIKVVDSIADVKIADVKILNPNEPPGTPPLKLTPP